MPDETVWRLGSGEEVFDRCPSHIHAGVTEELLREAFARSFAEPGQEKLKCTVDFGRTIGVSTRVETREGDEIIFAKRPDRDGLTCFVKNRAPEPTSCLTFTVRQQEDGRYILRTAYLGTGGFTEPWAAARDGELLADSIAFWQRNALCWGYEPVEAGTETFDPPW